MTYSKCNICPRECKRDREREQGFCSSGNLVRVARASRHFWEEPCISGDKGSGTVFFSGCNLKCVFCQNKEISRGAVGKTLDKEELKELFLKINDSGVHNINLVTPTHFIPTILDALRDIKTQLTIPVVYNGSGYEKAEVISECRGLIDIFLTDMKYKSSILSEKYSACPDYFDVAVKALDEMLRVAGDVKMKDNIMTSGVIVRHLVLPSHKEDSISVLKALSERYGSNAFLVSLMRQFTPTVDLTRFPEINRRLTSLEYKRVCETYEQYAFKGFMQERGSVGEKFIPDFNNKGEFLR